MRVSPPTLCLLPFGSLCPLGDGQRPDGACGQHGPRKGQHRAPRQRRSAVRRLKLAPAQHRRVRAEEDLTERPAQARLRPSRGGQQAGGQGSIPALSACPLEEAEDTRKVKGFEGKQAQAKVV